MRELILSAWNDRVSTARRMRCDIVALRQAQLGVFACAVGMYVVQTYSDLNTVIREDEGGVGGGELGGRHCDLMVG